MTSRLDRLWKLRSCPNMVLAAHWNRYIQHYIPPWNFPCLWSFPSDSVLVRKRFLVLSILTPVFQCLWEPRIMICYPAFFLPLLDVKPCLQSERILWKTQLVLICNIPSLGHFNALSIRVCQPLSHYVGGLTYPSPTSCRYPLLSLSIPQLFSHISAKERDS